VNEGSDISGSADTGAELDSGATLHPPIIPMAVLASPEDLGEILHGLNNVLVSIVLNAQFMEWKLPSYSLMRRNTHEIQRSAKRAGVLLKRLAGQPGAAQGAIPPSADTP